MEDEATPTINIAEDEIGVEDAFAVDKYTYDDEFGFSDVGEEDGVATVCQISKISTPPQKQPQPSPQILMKNDFDDDEDDVMSDDEIVGLSTFTTTTTATATGGNTLWRQMSQI